MNPQSFPSLSKRTAVLIYGVVTYAFFFATFCYAAGFVGNVLVPKSMDGPPRTSLGIALAINAGLLIVFALQHSVMARPFFKRWLARILPVAAERSTYVLMSSLALLLLFWQWQPMGGVVWQLQHPLAVGLAIAGFVFGWLLVLVTTFLINHFDLFGLRQVWKYFRGVPYQPLHFVTPGSLPTGSASSVCGVAPGILVHAHDDGGTSGFCVGNDRLHSRGNPSRGT